MKRVRDIKLFIVVLFLPVLCSLSNFQRFIFSLERRRRRAFQAVISLNNSNRRNLYGIDFWPKRTFYNCSACLLCLRQLLNSRSLSLYWHIFKFLVPHHHHLMSAASLSIERVCGPCSTLVEKCRGEVEEELQSES